MVSPAILCIDDSPLVHSLVARALAPYDVRLLHAEDGMMGLHFALNEAPELVLLDVKMPGLNGYEVLERLRGDQRTRNVPVLVVTSETVRENVTRLLKFGVQDYIVKPFDEGGLLKRISRHVALHRRGLPRATPATFSTAVQATRKPPAKKLAPGLLFPRETPTAANTKIRVQKFNTTDGQPIDGVGETSLAEKLEDYVLLLGSMNAYLVGIFMQLLESGKVRVEFRDRCERLTLADPERQLDRKTGIKILEDYMAKRGWTPDASPDFGMTQKIDLKCERIAAARRARPQTQSG